jgi:OmpA-OmpF porin, OOP family
MMRRIGLLLGILALSLLPRPAHAELVVGASIGAAGVDIDSADFDESDFSWKAFGGFRFFKFLGLKAEYLDLGNPEGELPVIGDVALEGTAWDVLAEGVLPLGSHFEIGVTAGYVFWDFEASASGLFSEDDSGEDFVYGAEAAFILNELIGIRAEWQRFDAGGETSVDFITAGVDFRF